MACRYLMPTYQPYGGKGWTLSCLLPPSCISLYANVLLKLESAQRGINSETFRWSVNSEASFSAARIFQMLLLDILLYSVLTWYFDQVAHLLLAMPCLDFHTQTHASEVANNRCQGWTHCCCMCLCVHTALRALVCSSTDMFAPQAMQLLKC